MDFAYNTLILTKEEVSFLSGAMGIKKLYGILALDKVPDEQDLFRILQSLIKKEFITCEDDAYVIDEEIKYIIKFMHESPKQRTYGEKSNVLPVKCVYYKDDKVLVCEQSYASENELSFVVLMQDELLEMLNEEGYSQEEFTENDTD